MERELLLEIRRCLLDLNDVLERYLQMERTAQLRKKARGDLDRPENARLEKIIESYGRTES